jgi:putative sigma-54 modulation protein
MNYNIKGTDVAVTDELRTYAEKKLQALEKLLGDSAARVDIVLQYLASEEKQFKTEMTLHDAKHPLHAECYGSSMHEAIDMTTGELVAELNKSKKKRQSNFRQSAVKVKEFLRGWRKTI